MTHFLELWICLHNQLMLKLNLWTSRIHEALHLWCIIYQDNLTEAEMLLSFFLDIKCFINRTMLRSCQGSGSLTKTKLLFMQAELTRDGKKACAMVSFSTLSLSEKVPWVPAGRKELRTRSWPRLATMRRGERELSGIRITGAPASMSRSTRDALWGRSRTCDTGAHWRKRGWGWTIWVVYF